ncbi:hypothetical protein D917_05183 [Trichinella nativa]|uniref:NADH dehydrogenase [ubiquinone] 1 beta subcomplex subunit 9 n=1 Tax=Trichinella nativa TaxID=6335 RepID=A0A1Y3EWW9_9BILA|nr:hypothetical protein D917_05183 [Trichinella nativa]
MISCIDFFRLECRYQKVMLRARFDYYKGEKDPVKKQQLLLDGLKELWTKRHPCPFTYTYDPYGCAYNREEPPPDSIVDVDWEHPERDQYPHYFAKREQRKKEVIRQWEKIKDSWRAKALLVYTCVLHSKCGMYIILFTAVLRKMVNEA